MKKRILLITCLLTIFFGGSALAADKIGFVDVREVMFNSEVGKKATEELNKLYEKKKPQIQESEQEFKKMKEEFDKQRTVLTESAFREKETALEKKFREYQAMMKEANNELQTKQQDLLKNILPEIEKVISVLGEKEKYLAIFDTSAVPIPYYSKTNDLTKRVMEEFNKSNKSKK